MVAEIKPVPISLTRSSYINSKVLDSPGSNVVTTCAASRGNTSPVSTFLSVNQERY
jgi:hypothetical protein